MDIDEIYVPLYALYNKLLERGAGVASRAGNIGQIEEIVLLICSHCTTVCVVQFRLILL